MSLVLRSIIEKGDLAKERLTLKATSDLDVGDYALLQCGLVDGTLTTEVLRAFWFPYSPVLDGDLVVLYSKVGESRHKTLASGSKAHFFYWGNTSPIWTEDRAAVILKAPEWSSKSLAELTK